jgi:cell wall-associated NlpC family hydrolase
MKRLVAAFLSAIALVVAIVAASTPKENDTRPAAKAKPAAAESTPKRPRPVPIGSRAVKVARGLLGVTYRWGGASPASGFDCSGLTYYVYKRLGVELPHSAAAQFGSGLPVPRSRLRPGDLLFFSGLGHVGMYVGGGRMIHSPESGDVVRIVRLGVDYGGTLIGARRIVDAHAASGRASGRLKGLWRDWHPRERMPVLRSE